MFSLIAVSGRNPRNCRVVNELPLDAVALDSLMPLIIVLLQLASKTSGKRMPLSSTATGDSDFRPRNRGISLPRRSSVT